jgi:hypothetical protein
METTACSNKLRLPAQKFRQTGVPNQSPGVGFGEV